MSTNKNTPQYSKEFKIKTVKLMVEEGQSLSETSRQLGVSVQTLCKWKRKRRSDGQQAFPGSGNSATEKDEELKRIKAENRKLRFERDILKEAVSYIAPDRK